MYYVHVACATSKREPFMSIFQTASLGKTYKNFKEDEHLNLLHCPFQDEGDNLLKRYMSNQHELIGDSKQDEGEMLTHASHQHPLVLFDKQTPAGVSLHDPMKRIQLLCDGCVKPIMTVPFYVCCQYCFVLHEWCAKLPAEVQEYVGHPQHTLFLLPKIPGKFFGVFKCAVCELPSNGFAYGCIMCDFYVDINCAFIPKEMTHDAHPNHLLSIVKPSVTQSAEYCKACKYWMRRRNLVFHCPSCNFYIHVECALLLPRVIKHKCDKHPLNLRYEPAENHTSKYFCEICEDEFTPWEWFYHCNICDQSMHAACVPLILQCEQNTYADNRKCVYEFLNVKFGGTLEIKDHPHRLAFVQGLESDGRCSKCCRRLQYKMIFKCLECEFALHFKCAYSSVN
ncbi:putative chromatin regulator PHD family [Helianthus annuus]|nr:putative chromatin regulator PHD family [Helianthus annuus]KAJ0865220.1 putative chromatin regulator PHD family [Helianthus annuus]